MFANSLSAFTNIIDLRVHWVITAFHTHVFVQVATLLVGLLLGDSIDFIVLGLTGSIIYFWQFHSFRPAELLDLGVETQIKKWRMCVLYFLLFLQCQVLIRQYVWIQFQFMQILCL